jgi:O-antigen/teichoic acid export membrane protein
VSWLIKGASGAPGYLLLLTGNQMKLVYNFTFMVVLDLILLFIFTKLWGMTGAAIASATAILISRIALVAVAQKATGIHTSILAGLFKRDLKDRPPVDID